MIFGTPNSTFLNLNSSQGMTFSSGSSLTGSSGMDQMMNELNIGQQQSPTTQTQPTKNTVLFDLSWEVAKKVGGIYTVLKTKAPITVEEYRSRYALIGPYNAETAPTEFEPLIPGPLSSPIIENMMKKYGIHVHFGKWLVEGYPKVFLIDLHSSMHKLGEWRWDLMSGFEQPGDFETNETIVFGYQSALLLKEFAEANPNDNYIAHFHEWQASVGLILLKKWKAPVSTIFTTHATLLGRYLAAGGVDLYNQMQNLNIDFEASKRGIYHRHWIEKRSAADAHVFTTVSEITAYESEHILLRKADVILPNGLKLDRFTALHEFQNLHAKYKGVLNEFVRGHFYGHYDFDLDNTLYLFTAGRAEYFNKGVDMYLDSLAGLNKLLQSSGSKMTIVAFIIMPNKTNNFNVESLKGHSYLKDMRRTCNSIVESMGERLFEATSKGKIISPEELMSQEDLVMLKRRIFALKQKSSLPPIVTHNMVDDYNDPILQHIRRIKMFNAPEDRVKIIYHPEFLTSTNPLIPLDYTEFVRGCHLGIFPSYYEPFGMTASECCASGCPTITSNLTGFANYMNRALPDPDSKGIYIVDRRFKSSRETVEQMTQYLWKFCQLDRRQRIELRNATEKLSELLDWKTLGKFYKTARALALERAFPPPAIKSISRSPSPSPTSSLKLSTGLPNLIDQQQQQQQQTVKTSPISITTSIPPVTTSTKPVVSSTPAVAATPTTPISSSSTKAEVPPPTTTTTTTNTPSNVKPNVIPINAGKESGGISYLSPNSMSSLLSDSLQKQPKNNSTTPSVAKPQITNPTPTPSPTTSSFIPISNNNNSNNKNTTTTTSTSGNSNGNTTTKINPIEALTKSNSNGSLQKLDSIETSNTNKTNSPATKSIPIPSSKSLK